MSETIQPLLQPITHPKTVVIAQKRVSEINFKGIQEGNIFQLDPTILFLVSINYSRLEIRLSENYKHLQFFLLTRHFNSVYTR